MKLSILVRKDGRITIPKQLRDLHGLTAATKVQLSISGDSLSIATLSQNQAHLEDGK